MHHYIGHDSSFVHSPLFENGTVKVQREQLDSLLQSEKNLLEPFSIANIQGNDHSSHSSLSLSVQALNRTKRRRVPAQYLCLNHIPPTSNIVERLFSSARLILTDYRKSMDPYTFECLMFLQVNRSKWDINVVSQLI